MGEPVVKQASNPTKKKIKEEVEEEEEPIRSIFCLKKKEMMREIEEEEDCFILDFDPFEEESVLQLSKLSIRENPDIVDADLVVVAEKGQVACRDYPHPRYLCVKFPFGKTRPDQHCPKCYCSICDKPAPCLKWTLQGDSHCHIVKRRIYCSESSYSSDSFFSEDLSDISS